MVMVNQTIMDYSKEAKQSEPFDHTPVMLKEVIEYLKPQPGNIFIDGTIGLGGHAEALLNQLGVEGRLIGLDRDSKVLIHAREVLANQEAEYDLIHQDYRNIDQVLSGLNIPQVDGILLDLGISSFQLDDPERGFGFRKEGPLDMRMDQNSYMTAFTLVNSLSEKEISTILKDLGQERWHNRIARSIVRQRENDPIKTTKELSDLILRAIPSQRKRQKIHPATRTFQALRIAVNRELEGLEEVLDKCVNCLKANGRIGVIAFHSLEDRIVKQKFRGLAKSGQLNLIVKKPLRPSDEEVSLNPRARSARFRVAERI